MVVEELSPEQLKQLLAVRPSGNERVQYRPAQAVLKNGEIVNAIFVDELSFRRIWRISPEEGPRYGYHFILIENVVSISESPCRLRPDLKRKLSDAGESGMGGYSCFTILFDTGDTIDVLQSGMLDFIPLPEGMYESNITDVIHHMGPFREFVTAPIAKWCLHKPSAVLGQSTQEDSEFATNLKGHDEDSTIQFKPRTWLGRVWQWLNHG